MSLYNSECPVNCDNLLPVFDFNNCNKATKFGEITKMYFMSVDGTPLTLFGQAGFDTEFLARIDNVSTSDNAIRSADVRGTLAVPSREEIILSGLVKQKAPATFVVNFSIDDLSDYNKALIRQSQCNIHVMGWFQTPDLFFGGNDGIEGDLFIDFEITEGENSLNRGVGTFTWRAKQMPEFIDNPLT